MAVSFPSGERPWFERTGALDFYAVIDPTPGVGKLHRLGFTSGPVASRFPIIEPAYAMFPLQPMKPDGNGGETPTTKTRSQLEVFLMTLYGAQLNIFQSLSSVEESLNLDAQILEAGQEAQYESIQIVDFLALTGAVSRFWKVTGNGTVNVLELGPDDERPEITELERGDGGLQLEQVVKYVGLFSLVKRLFAAGAISFDKLNELYHWFWPNRTERMEKVFGRFPNDPGSLQAYLVAKRHPLLTEGQKLKLSE